MALTDALKLLLLLHLLQMCVLVVVIGVVLFLYFKLRKVCLSLDKIHDLLHRSIQTQTCNTVCLTDIHGMMMSISEDKKPDMYKLSQKTNV
jgi:hypothetical protein